MNKNGENLRLLGVFHYVVAAFAALFSMIPVIHLLVGTGMTVVALTADDKELFPLVFIGVLFIVIAACFILAGLTFATCLFLSGRFLERRKHYNFCLFMAGFACIFMPFGTILGVFTIITLMKEEVKEMFQARKNESAVVMTKHVVLLKEKNRGTLTPELLLQHIDHLKALKRKGQLILCGPFKDDSGAFLLIAAPSQKDAEAIVKEDPFIKQGYYRSFEVRELQESGEHNNWLMDDDQKKENMR
jgi:uncharacterized protein YciI